MRNFLKMPPQVFRLVLLAVGIVVSYSVARYFLTPQSFGQYGWYRGNALIELTERDQVYAGKKACEECHADEYLKLNKGSHKTLSCETCHGAGKAHVDNPDKGNIEKSTYAACVRCHEANRSRPKWFKQIVPKDHYAGSKCSECHVPHSPTEVP